MLDSGNKLEIMFGPQLMVHLLAFSRYCITQDTFCSDATELASQQIHLHDN